MIQATGNILEILKVKSSIKGVDKASLKNFEALMRNFDKFEDTFIFKADEFTNKNWRQIKADCIAVQRIPIRKTKKRTWEIICAEFAALGEQEKFTYDTRKTCVYTPL